MVLLWASIICMLLNRAVSAIPKPEDKRVLDNDLSHAQHFQDDAHNKQYDHEAFLGEDQAKTFDQLTPEESRRRLGIIVGKIDENKDGLIDLAELKNWIRFTQRRYIEDDVERQWKQHNPQNNETLHWEARLCNGRDVKKTTLLNVGTYSSFHVDIILNKILAGRSWKKTFRETVLLNEPSADVYRKSVYGFMDEMDPQDIEKENNGFSYKSMLTRDRRRWSVADRNGDDNLTRSEFTEFLHPEESPRMRDIVVAETLEDIDKDNDGKVSVDEYIGDMYRGGEGDEEPEWVQNERDVFTKFRDKDHDNYMSFEEVKEWIIPPDFDHAEAEARHLIYEGDSDADEKLTKDEIIDKYDLFVGSQATDFGDALTRHDEF